jgi:hypothetical protein
MVIKLSLICCAAITFIWLGLVEIVAIKRLWTRLTHLQVVAKA